MPKRRTDGDGTQAARSENRKTDRLVPVQKRSRERFERILACAAEVMAEKGSDAFRMSDIVERTGIAFGSLYQYFPDKTAIIGTLAERCNAIGRECVRSELLALRSISELQTVLGRITDGYYRFFVDEPVVLHIWRATQTDHALQKLDEEDGAFLAGLLVDALRPLATNLSEAELADFGRLVMVLMSAAVRHAVALTPEEGRRLLALFKKTLPRDLDW